jgi:pullulanase
MCLEGRFSKGTVKAEAIDPNLVINYAACHDNYTLYDQLVQTMNEERLPVAYTQAEAIVFLSEGVPFIQEGEDFMRSKYNETDGKYDGNSYISGDFVNVMDYSLKIKHLDTFEKIKELIALRKAEAALRLSSRDEIKAKVKDVAFDGGIIRFTVDGLKVVHTVNGGTLELDGNYEIIYSNVREQYGEVSNEISLLTNESVVLKKAG